jgi:hypothetical protein
MPIERCASVTQSPTTRRACRFSCVPPWQEFFRSIYYALFGWKRTYTATLTFDFGNINAQTQATTTLTVTGRAPETR